MTRQTLWEVLNDLIAHGVEKDTYEIVVKEMLDMFLIKVEVNSFGQEEISLLNPALGDIAYDVCTPEQIDSICKAILERVSPLQDYDFRVPFLMASFHHRLDDDESMMLHLWKKGYNMLMQKRDDIPESTLHGILEAIDEEITACSYETRVVLGDDFSYPSVNENHVGKDLLMVKFYIGPIVSITKRDSFYVSKRNFLTISVDISCRLLVQWAIL